MKYGTVFYQTKKALGITANQWLYLDIVRGLSIANEDNNYYASASNAYYADMIDVSVRTIQKYSAVLSEMGLLLISSNGHRRTTKAFNKLYIQARKGEEQPFLGGEESSPLGVKKVHGGGEESSPNNNTYNNRDNNNYNSFKGSNFLQKFKEVYGIHNLARTTKASQFLCMMEKEQALVGAKLWADYFKTKGTFGTDMQKTSYRFLEEKLYLEKPPRIAKPQQASRPQEQAKVSSLDKEAYKETLGQLF